MSKTLELVGGRINRARLFFENIGDMYIALGKTSSWSDEENPPEPTGMETDMVEVLGFKRVDQKFFVVEDLVEGTLSFRDKKWRIVEPGDIFSEGSRWVYVSASIVGSELPLTDYRQVGLFSGLIPNVGFEGMDVLTPGQVNSRGVLEILGNRKRTTRQDDQTERVILIMEF